jgi:hypothetical protein
MFFVLNSETVRPLVRTAILWAIGSRPGTTNGSIGLNVSMFFARDKVRSLAKSLRAYVGTAQPSIPADAPDAARG